MHVLACAGVKSDAIAEIAAKRLFKLWNYVLLLFYKIRQFSVSLPQHSTVKLFMCAVPYWAIFFLFFVLKIFLVLFFYFGRLVSLGSLVEK